MAGIRRVQDRRLRLRRRRLLENFQRFPFGPRSIDRGLRVIAAFVLVEGVRVALA